MREVRSSTWWVWIVAAAVLVATVAPPAASAAAEGNQALVDAASRGDLASVSRLLASGAAVDPPKQRPAALLAAIRGGHLAVAQALVDAGANPDWGSGSDGSPLVTAVAGGWEAIVDFLLGRGARPGPFRDGEKADPLFVAAELGHVAIVERLLAAGRKPDPSTLWVAARKGREDVVDRLLAAGGDPDAPYRNGTTPLMAAARAGEIEVARRLLRAGADPQATNRSGETAISLAAGEGEEAMVDLLETEGGVLATAARDTLFEREQAERRAATGVGSPEPEATFEKLGLTFLKPRGFGRYGGDSETHIEVLISEGASRDRNYSAHHLVKDELRIDIERFGDPAKEYERTDEHAPFPLRGTSQRIEVPWRGRTLDGVRAEETRLDDTLITLSVDLALESGRFRVTLRGPSARRDEIDAVWPALVESLGPAGDAKGPRESAPAAGRATPGPGETKDGARRIPIWAWAALGAAALLAVVIRRRR